MYVLRSRRRDRTRKTHSNLFTVVSSGKGWAGLSCLLHIDASRCAFIYIRFVIENFEGPGWEDVLKLCGHLKETERVGAEIGTK